MPAVMAVAPRPCVSVAALVGGRESNNHNAQPNSAGAMRIMAVFAREAFNSLSLIMASFTRGYRSSAVVDILIKA